MASGPPARAGTLPATAGTSMLERRRLRPEASMAVHPAVVGDPLDAVQLLAALNAFKKGDFSVRLPDEWTGVAGRIADAFNETVEMNERMAAEFERLSRAVGKEGKVNQRASLGEAKGSWAGSVQNVKALVADMCGRTT